MVCHSCIVTVEDILNKAVIPYLKVLFGEIHLVNELIRVQREILVGNLKKNEGFELIECRLDIASVEPTFVRPPVDYALIKGLGCFWIG